ncbi:anthranilate synthase component I family protein [Acetonema longum]|uniref:Anthranilate synthase component I n=1 Tax=Acetonema longum DSM 6540 TaxID=1009370 RepID=F7NDP6_9FIRM|nr:anthranilate synthase component I family protein [Acetonema longum]EGO65815.1 anthranilate synthase component I [Acetonema longum DSM 6540]
MRLSVSGREFSSLDGSYTIIPVYTEIPVDLDTPVSLYYKLVGDSPGFMLESAESGKNFGRYSFIGSDPMLRLTAYSDRMEVVADQRRYHIAKSPLTALQEVLAGFSCPDFPDLPPFSGGAVGYLSFEAAATWERVRGMSISPEAVLGQFMICRKIVAMDHLTHTAKLIVLVQPGLHGVQVAYDTAVAELRQMADQLKQPVLIPAEQAPDSGREPLLPPDDPPIKQSYMEAVRAAKEYIAAGDIFQVVLSHPFTHPLTAPPFMLYRRLRRINPSPYMFYFNTGNLQIVGASPEMLVKLQGGKVYSCPIAGTRPRGQTAGQDAALAAELLADVKECAEHAMLVDLGRNDIGRISLPGTVAASRLMEVENFSHVMHIVSEVTGQVDPKYMPTDVLAACFPAGTVSGAPKCRAMEIINELETAARDSYAGSVGYIDFRGNMDTCITIRTMAIEGDQVTIRAGAGIVADSVPELEYQEIRHKAKALFRVLGGE